MVVDARDNGCISFVGGSGEVAVRKERLLELPFLKHKNTRKNQLILSMILRLRRNGEGKHWLCGREAGALSEKLQ